MVRKFREMRPSCSVVAFVKGSVGHYFGVGDKVVEGDVQETIPQLAQYLLGDV